MFKLVVLSALLAVVAAAPQVPTIHDPLTGAVSHQHISTPVLTDASLLAGHYPHIAGSPWSAYAAHQAPWAAGMPHLAAARLHGSPWGVPSPLAYSGVHPGNLGHLGHLGYAGHPGYAGHLGYAGHPGYAGHLGHAGRLGYGNYW